MSRLLLTDPAPVSASLADAHDLAAQPEAGAGLPHINAWRGASALSVQETIHITSREFDQFRARMLMILRHLDENLPLDRRLHIDSFLGTLADLQGDLIGDLMRVGDELS